MAKTLTPDQARLNAVIAQRNNALDAVAEHEALVTVLSQELEGKTRALQDMTKERDELKAKYEPPPVNETPKPTEVTDGPA